MTIDFAILAVNGSFSLLFIAGLTTAFYSFVFGFMMRNGILLPTLFFVGNSLRGFILLDLV
jgi:hypothetical protein